MREIPEILPRKHRKPCCFSMATGWCCSAECVGCFFGGFPKVIRCDTATWMTNVDRFCSILRETWTTPCIQHQSLGGNHSNTSSNSISFGKFFKIQNYQQHLLALISYPPQQNKMGPSITPLPLFWSPTACHKLPNWEVAPKPIGSASASRPFFEEQKQWVITLLKTNMEPKNVPL